MTLKLKGEFQRGWRAMLVYITFALTIVLWMTTSWHGMNTYVVAIIPLAVFTLTGIMGKEELKQINWDVLWLVAGGIAIGIGLEQTGLAQALAHSIDYQSLSPMLIVIALSLVCWLMANFMSNTATANLIMPIAAAIGTSMSSLEQVGGLQALLVVVAFFRVTGDDFARFDTAQLACLLNGAYRKQRYGKNGFSHWGDWAWHRLSDGVPTRINSLFLPSFTACHHSRDSKL